MTVIPAPAWDDYLRLHFPGYLLPEASLHALSEEAAQRFLEGLGARPGELLLLCAASLVTAHVRDLDAFARVHLPDLLRALRHGASAQRATFEGRAPGRLDVAATLRSRMEGRSTRFTVHAPERSPDRPETLLVKSVARRIVAIATILDRAGLAARAGWGASIAASSRALARALASPALRAVPDAPITAHHERCAFAAPHPAYARAASLHRALSAGLDARSPRRLARAVAEGALLPRADAARFELAVLLRLVEALAARLEPAGFTLHRTLIVSDRLEIADFARAAHHVRVYYNQACLDPGPYDAGLRRYLGQTGRLRPDVTVVREIPRESPRAVVIEAKLTADPSYLAQGLQEAFLYRAEHASHLRGWPQSILVTSSPLPGEPRREDDVIAVGWDRWVPAAVIDGLLEGLVAADDDAFR
jgi:hypothetical protein